MKTRALPLFALLFIGGTTVFAQWAVFDVANLQQSVTNYAALTEQIAKQAQQISNQVQQIRQFETQLQRLGDMASVRNLVGFSDFRLDLDLPTQIRSWSQTLPQIDGRGLFGDTRDGLFREITPDFPDFDGGTILRDERVYKNAHAIVASVDGYRTVQDDIYRRREDLKRAIGRTSDALQGATTVAEQQKLAALLDAQYGELAALDAEVEMSATEVQVKTAEAEAMAAAEEKAQAEARSRLAQEESRKVTTAFKPSYECLLQYVSERRLAP